MDSTVKEKFSVSLKAAPKMESVQWMAAVGTLGGIGAKWFLALTQEQQLSMIQAVVGHWSWGIAAAPMIASAIGILLRLRPSKSITPVEAAAKSVDAPQATTEGDASP